MIGLLFLFNAMVTAQFVPFSISVSPQIPVVTDDTLENVISDEFVTIILVVSMEDEHLPMYVDDLHEMSMLFVDSARFFIIDEAETSLLNGVHHNTPMLMVYAKSDLIGIFPYPESIEMYVTFCRQLLGSPPAVVRDVDGIYENLGGCAFALITNPDQAQKGLTLYTELAMRNIYMKLIIVEPNVIKGLGFERNSYILFRRQDSVLTCVEPNVEDILQALPSIYNIYEPDDIIQSGPILAIVEPEMNEEIDASLFEVGLMSLSFSVGYISKDLRDFLVNIMEYHFIENSSIVAFCPADLYYYDVKEYFPGGYNPETFAKQASDFADLVESGKVHPIYPSEPLTESKDGVIVGLNYEEFIMDEDKDVVVLYHDGSKSELMNEFNKLKETLPKSYKLGTINIKRNSCQKEYPFFPQLPHVQLFPAKNKTESCSIFGNRDKGSLMALLKRCGSEGDKIEAEPDNPALLMWELEESRRSSEFFSESVAKRAKRYFEEMQSFLTKFVEERTDNFSDEL